MYKTCHHLKSFQQIITPLSGSSNAGFLNFTQKLQTQILGYKKYVNYALISDTTYHTSKCNKINSNMGAADKSVVITKLLCLNEKIHQTVQKDCFL